MGWGAVPHFQPAVLLILLLRLFRSGRGASVKHHLLAEVHRGFCFPPQHCHFPFFAFAFHSPRKGEQICSLTNVCKL